MAGQNGVSVSGVSQSGGGSAPIQVSLYSGLMACAQSSAQHRTIPMTQGCLVHETEHQDSLIPLQLPP